MRHRDKVVVFDLGGVLIHWDPYPVFQRRLDWPDEKLLAFMRAEFREIALQSCQEDVSLAELANRYSARHPEFAECFDIFAEHWNEFVVGPMPQTVALLEELAAAHPVFALTNWPAATFPPRAPERHTGTTNPFAFLECFEDIVVSASVGLRKPHPEIFDYTLQRFGLHREQCLFVDDMPGNIEAAQSLGIESHHFQSADELRSWLIAYGLLE